MHEDELLEARQARIDELHRCRPLRTALVVIDMQRGFLEPGAALEVPPGREIVPNIARLIGLCREKQVPVIFSQFIYTTALPCLRGDPFGVEHLPHEKGGPSGFGYPSNNCRIDPDVAPGPNAADVVDELAPQPGELVVAGHTYDKFYGTPLELALRARDVRWLILTGVLTEICVNATLLSAANRDFRVTAVSDGVATLWPELQEACFEIWRHKFARLRTTLEMTKELSAF